MNNTLTEPEKKSEDNKGTETDKHGDKDISAAEEKGQEGTAGGKKEDANSGNQNATAFDREDKPTATEETVSKGGNNGESDGSDKTTGGSTVPVGGRGTDDGLNTVEEVERKVGEPPERNQSGHDVKAETNITEIHIRKDKGQEEKLRKEEQVNGKKDTDKVGPNDTKLRAPVSEEENTADVLKQDKAENRTVAHDTKQTQKQNNSTDSTGRGEIDLTRLNVTQYTLYRAGGAASSTQKEKQEETKKDSAEETLLREAEEKKKEEEREANLSFTGEWHETSVLSLLSGASLSVCSLPTTQRKAARLRLASHTATTRRRQGRSHAPCGSPATTRTF